MSAPNENVFVSNDTIVSPIILVGPTTTGKSSVSKLIAETVGAEIVNSDRLYTYASDELNLGLGLEPDELKDGIVRHLYGIRRPVEQPLDVQEYMSLAKIGRAHV